LADRDVSALGIITRDFHKKNNLEDAHWLVYEFGMFLTQCFGSGQAYKALSDLCFEDSFFHRLAKNFSSEARVGSFDWSNNLLQILNKNEHNRTTFT
jgi:hypothetical protein